uniref:Serpin domain-containing protein n=1 Tax=Aegilops tauschii subsp. strangulata TaxID=200361 RepID=A0A453E6V4_AEGTS|nr:putative serpin-Z5 [Aegilops tauschii subsp. strangulata]
MFFTHSGNYFQVLTNHVWVFGSAAGEAVKQINAWAAAATNNLIDSVLTEQQVSTETDVVVANAVYFKATWDSPFRERNTEDDKFYRLDGTAFDVAFMQSGKKQYIACHQGFKVLKLDYRQGHVWSSPPASFSMCVFLPDDRDGLQGLVQRIASSPDFIRAHLPTRLVSVGDFKLPRFKLAFSADMSDILRRLGLHVAGADMSNMVEDDGTGRPLALSGIVHKAVIEVNEDGTEAAAVTAGLMCGCAPPPKTPPVLVDFVADHPFAFFVIEEESGAIVFAGNILEPSPSIPGENLRRRESVRRAPNFVGRRPEHPWTLGAIDEKQLLGVYSRGMDGRPFVQHEAASCNPILLFACVCLVVAFFFQLVRLLVM